MNTILRVLWLLLPASANTAPVIANNISFLKKYDRPLDFSKTFRGKRIFGSHKTIRGLVAGIFQGFTVSLIQMILAINFSWFNSLSLGLDYRSPSILLFGAILGFSALAGDAIKSFFKRQFNIQPGDSWFIFDQIDFMLGSLVASRFFITLPWHYYFLIILTTIFIHPIFNLLSWLLKLQSKPF